MTSLVLGVCLFVLTTCTPHIHGPNYNQGRTHNQSKDLRMKIVYKEDTRMKKVMNKSRKLASPRNVKQNSKKIIN